MQTPPPVLRVALGPSPRLAILLLAAHGGAAAALMLTPLDALVLMVALAALAASAAFTLYRHALRRGAAAVVALECRDREQLALRLGDGRWFEGTILGSSTVSTVLTVLNIRCNGRPRRVHVVLLGDGIAAEDYRRLRVWLRWGPRPAARAASQA